MEDEFPGLIVRTKEGPREKKNLLVQQEVTALLGASFVFGNMQVCFVHLTST